MPITDQPLPASYADALRDEKKNYEEKGAATDTSGRPFAERVKGVDVELKRVGS